MPSMRAPHNNEALQACVGLFPGGVEGLVLGFRVKGLGVRV